MDVVECRPEPGARTEYAERPLSLIWKGCRLEIAEIISRWHGPGEKGFRVKTVDGQAFELTYQEFADAWHVQPM